MSKDYKQSSSRKPSSKGGSGGSSVLTGLLIGLCIGVGVAVAFAYYMKNLPTPFGGKGANTNATQQPGLPGAAAQPAQANAAPGATPAASPAAQPPAASSERFDFYKMLPSGGDDKQAAAQKPGAAPKPADATPPATVQPPKGIYLQAGAFQHEEDADNLKAKLAMLGVEANIQTTELKDAGVVHRVRVGPLNTGEEVDRVRAELRVNGIEPSVVKN
ncbi:MAG: SPOR domain-containing protein [Burkholderiales bacterium]|nr:SPOR domain-containing protein [Burkholderiales bacterium]